MGTWNTGPVDNDAAADLLEGISDLPGDERSALLADQFVRAAQLTVVGAIRLVRMIPVLELSGPPFLGDVKAIIEVRGREPDGRVADEAARLWEWVDGDGPDELIPSVIDVYLKSCSVAIAVAGLGDMDSRTYAIEDDTMEFWSACDDLVHRVNGYSRSEFGGLKTTLAGVEQMWCERDWTVVRSGMPLREAFDTQVQNIGETLDRRWSIARGIARCAGWLDDDQT